MATSPAALGCIGVVIALVLLSSRLFRVKVDPREPPVVHPRIPFVGHLVGFLSSGPLFLKRISQQCRHPIFTLPMLSGRTYVVTSPALAAAVQRSSSTLDFDEMIVQVFPRMINLNDESRQILADPTAKEEGRTRLISRVHSVVLPRLASNNIQDVSGLQLKHFMDYFNGLEDGHEAELFHLVTRELTAASMYSFYGPNNPFALKTELLDGFWDWERGNVAYMVNIMQRITARKAFYGSEACVEGFLEYIEAGRMAEAHELVQDRKRLHDEYGVSIPEQARFEMIFAFAINSNAGITSFWTVNNLFSRPDLLKQVQEEIQTNALVGSHTISFKKLRDSCPLLNSVYRESARLVSPMTSARLVLEDTMLADKYLLKKDAVVQIAGGVIHYDPDIWGPDVASFNPHRFLYTMNGTKADASGNISDTKANTVHPAAFRGFGGGVTLCPGRHFAQMEILSLTALLAMGFEMEPVKGKKNILWDPPRDDKRFPLAVTKPLRNVDVKLKRRRGYKNVKWVLQY